jgi:Zn-dependent protease
MLNLSPSLLISRIITLLVALTVHEFSHAFVADRLGDDTPRNAGRLTLNPLKHLDFIGSLLLLVVGFGWAKPVPVNPWKLRQHSRSALMWVSLAGPASNLLMAIVAALVLRSGVIPNVSLASFLPTPISFLLTFIVINLVLMLFNLIPVSPLDGEKILETLLPEPLRNGYIKLQPYGPILLLILMFVLPRFGIDIISWVMNPAISGLSKILIGG